ncbi:MAG: hypothetical protein PHP01_03630 [Phycisphaerae bacterium]|nr:hypothetical protein [Phycisphaerae bacterium]
MGKSILKLLVIFIAVAAVFATFAAAEEKATQSDSVQSVSVANGDSVRDRFHNPTDWLSMGADLRARWTYGWNLDTLNNDAANYDSGWNWYQQRMRWWTKTKINDDMDFNLRFTWEFRVWDVPERKGMQTDFDEIIWDQFNLTVRNFGNMPLTMVVGRQDIILGAGWLVLEGTPLDESRTIFFDALRFTYQPDEDTTLDLIYIENRASEDAYLKPINSRRKETTQQDERGLIVYLTDKSRPNLQLEGYFIYKNDNPIDSPPSAAHDPWPAAVWSKKAQIYTFGGALSGAVAQSEHWKYRVEGAIQTGKKQTQQEGTAMHNLMAFGTIDRIEYHFNDAHKNKLRGTFEFRSGDDPGTGKNEAFDPLWGEYPQYSEIACYAQLLETMVGEITNLYRFGIGHSIQLTEKVSMDTDYYLLYADQNTEKNRPHAGVISFSDSGKFRGFLNTWMLNYQMTKNLSGHILVEYFQPGNYYQSGNRDAAYFARMGLDYTF